MSNETRGKKFTGGRRFAAVVGLLAWLMSVQFSGAQTAGTGAFSGSVIDPGGGSVAGAKIVVTSQATGEERVVVSDERGGFLVSTLLPQLYRVEVTKDGFKMLSIRDVKVTVAERRH